jgi:hypothetical protein
MFNIACALCLIDEDEDFIYVFSSCFIPSKTKLLLLSVLIQLGYLKEKFEI